MRRYRDPLVVLILLLLPFVFYLSNVKDNRDYNAFDRSILFISAPVQWLVVHALDGVADIWTSYVALVGVEEENAELRGRVAALEAQLAARVEQAEENARLHLLLELRGRSAEVEPISARIIADSPTPLFRSVRIDRGSNDGVHIGAAVVNYQGVVGRVAAVAGDWSTVMLLVDANSSTDVLVQRTRVRARVRGFGGDRELGVKVEYLARADDVEPGDILVTSGVGTVFPKGLRVGRIVSVERGAFGRYQEAWVEPSVDFLRLEEVMVIRRGWARDTTYEEAEEVREVRGRLYNAAAGQTGGAQREIPTAPEPETGSVVPAPVPGLLADDEPGAQEPQADAEEGE